MPITGAVVLIFYIESLSIAEFGMLGVVSTTAAESLSKPLLLKEETGAFFESSAALRAGLRLLWFDTGFAPAAAGSKLLYVLDNLSWSCLFSVDSYYV